MVAGIAALLFGFGILALVAVNLVGIKAHDLVQTHGPVSLPVLPVPFWMYLVIGILAGVGFVALGVASIVKNRRTR